MPMSKLRVKGAPPAAGIAADLSAREFHVERNTTQTASQRTGKRPARKRKPRPQDVPSGGVARSSEAASEARPS